MAIKIPQDKLAAFLSVMPQMIAENKGNVSSGPDCEPLRESGLSQYFNALESIHTGRIKRDMTWSQERLDDLGRDHAEQLSDAASALSSFLEAQFTESRDHAVKELRALADSIQNRKQMRGNRSEPTQRAQLLQAVLTTARSKREIQNADELVAETGIGRRKASAVLTEITERTGVKHDDRRSHHAP